MNEQLYYDLLKEHDSKDIEALHRTIISRIYYSIILEIRDKHGIPSDGVLDVHKKIIKAANRGSRGALNNMRIARRKADYYTDEKVVISEVEDQFDYYNKVKKFY